MFHQSLVILQSHHSIIAKLSFVFVSIISSFESFSFFQICKTLSFKNHSQETNSKYEFLSTDLKNNEIEIHIQIMITMRIIIK